MSQSWHSLSSVTAHLLSTLFALGWFSEIPISAISAARKLLRNRTMVDLWNCARERDSMEFSCVVWQRSSRFQIRSSTLNAPSNTAGEFIKSYVVENSRPSRRVQNFWVLV
ncbi:hypothetical protein HDK64DRAFT_87897 [Phyllosticta capitalensis]